MNDVLEEESPSKGGERTGNDSGESFDDELIGLGDEDEDVDESDYDKDKLDEE